MKNKRIYIISGLIDKLGTNIFNYIISLYFFKSTGDTFLGGVATFLSAGLVVVLNILVGDIIDRSNKKKMLVTVNILTGVITILISFNLNNNNKNFYFLILLILFRGINLIVSIINKVIVKYIFSDKKEISKMNSYEIISKEIISIVAPLFAGLLYGVDYRLICLINGLSFLLAGLYQMGIKFKIHDNYKLKKKEKKQFNHIKIFKSLDSRTRKEILIATISNFFIAGIFLYIPVIAIQKFDNESYNYIYISLISLGALVGGIIAKNIKSGNVTESLKMSLAISVAIVIGNINLFLFLASGFFLGVITAIYNITFFTNIQNNNDEGNLGKIVSTIFLFAGVATPIGGLIFGYLGHYLGSNSFYFIGFMNIIALVLINKKITIEGV